MDRGDIAQYARWQNLPSMFFDQAAAMGDKPFLWHKTDGTYQSIPWSEAARCVVDLARGLRLLGIEPGDRVVLVSENRPEWLIADLAIMAAGAITVPAYTTNTTEDHLHILTNSGAAGVIVSTRRLAERLLPAVHTAPELQIVISIEELTIAQDIGPEVHLWREVLDQGAAIGTDVIAEAATLPRDGDCCIIYTSGTGGAPKGVVLHHGAILCNVMGAHDTLLELGLDDEVFLSFLPLSHAYEHSAGQFFPIGIGAQIYYAEGVESLVKNLSEAHPTLMTAVPRLYEMMHQRISRDILKGGGLKAKLFAKTIALGKKEYREPGSLGPIDALINWVLDKLVRDKIRARFGGRLKALVSGGAPLPEEIGLFFTALGLRLLQGYGQTEAAPVISVNRPQNIKLHTVGPPMTGVEVKIADDGEILVRGELVMHGYWHNEEATAAALKDGWLHTGDIGMFDADGYIQITDRKKDIIINSGGDNLSPQRVEGFITLEHEIAQAMVFGDKRPYLVAVLVPDPDFTRQWMQDNGHQGDPEGLIDDPEFRKALMAAVDRVNKHLSNIEKVRRFMVTMEAFTIENEQLTPTMKIRRHKIIEQYGNRLVGLYEGKP